MHGISKHSSKFSCATFKTFKSLLVLWTVFSSWGSMLGYSLFNLSNRLISGLVAFTSAYPIILQKELATGCPVPTNYNFNRLNSLHIFALIYHTSNDTSEIPVCVKQREKGWSALLVEITSFIGAALISLFDKGNTVFIRYHSLT